jgi:hypothetical protein
MDDKSQFPAPRLLALIVGLCTLPSVYEAMAIGWGYRHGMTGKALRDGVDFWAGGFLLRNGQVPMLFDHTAYQAFLTGLFGPQGFHMWSYPPTYGLIAALFAALPPWPAALCYDGASLLVLALVLRFAGKSWGFVLCMLLAPATLENALEHQNAALLTALIGGGLLMLEKRPRMAGVLMGLATFKPQLGLVLPLNIVRRSPIAALYAALVALSFAALAGWVFGGQAWVGFLRYTSPVMSNVLLTGQPKDFSAGLVCAFASVKPFLGVHGALVFQGLVSVACVVGAVFTRSPPALLILGALASPYLHDYDLLGVGLATALLVEQRFRTGFRPGEPVLFFLAWFGPGLLPWQAQYAHLTPLLLVILLASTRARGGKAA